MMYAIKIKLLQKNEKNLLSKKKLQFILILQKKYG